MQGNDLAVGLNKVLQRPDLMVVAEGLRVDMDPALKVALSLRYTSEGPLLQLGGSSPRFLELAPTFLRYGIELVHLLEAGVPSMLASFASARVAAMFHLLDVAEACPLPLFLSPFAAPRPNKDVLLLRAPELCAFLPDAEVPNEAERLTAAHKVMELWSLLAPTETLMGGGGDSRLSVNPQTGLNRYACSHRPRPWAIAFGSSTASSLSERGFGGAEEARRRMIRHLLSDEESDHVQQQMLFSVRQRIGKHFDLSAENVILNASGTDCELAVLGLVAADVSQPISNILIAPDETGSGVPLAARGRHFASDSACADTVEKGKPIEGFPDDVDLISIPIRAADGSTRPREDIDQECYRIARQEADKGHHVLLHRLDQSKTGVVAPSIDVIDTLMQELGSSITVVVDACQARISPQRIAHWVQKGMMVMLTGSKFFTGPPFCGALLLPETAHRTLNRASLPIGLRHYSNRDEWPSHADPNALGNGHNLGLALRWEAALAEMDALFSHSDQIIRSRLKHFMDHAKAQLSRYPQLQLLPTPFLGNDGLWDSLPTILSFLVEDPRQMGHPLSLDDARRLHRWLNADLTPWIHDPQDEPGLLCVLGQPVPVSHSALSEQAGALRLCAGARLVSGEPSHAHMDDKERLKRECDDVERVLRKLLLILRHWDVLLEADPVPRYAPLS